MVKNQKGYLSCGGFPEGASESNLEQKALEEKSPEQKAVKIRIRRKTARNPGVLLKGLLADC